MSPRTPPAKSAPADTLVEHVIESLREAIRQGELAQGERLVVADVAKAYGVSVGPVREAIRRLTGEGMLEFTPHRGASVRAYSERGVREIFQAREAIEGYVARLAAENIHRADYAERMRNLRKRLQDTLHGNVKALSDARQSFHDVLYEIAGNEVLKEAGLRLTFPVNRLLFTELMGRVRMDASHREHEDIIDAILAGDGARAERAMRAHLHNGAIAVCEVLEQSKTVQRDRSKKA
jgi:DNA-binding GntR family transcriptional regulator